jgi:phosphoenolpyruvate carboxylase
MTGDREWNEEQRQKWLMSELTGKRPLLPPGLQPTPEVAETLSTFRVLAELPPDSLGAYVISMAHTASDVLAVVLLQVVHQCRCSAPTLSPGTC